MSQLLKVLPLYNSHHLCWQFSLIYLNIHFFWFKKVSSSLICHNICQSSWDCPTETPWRNHASRGNGLTLTEGPAGGLSVTEESIFPWKASEGNQKQHKSRGSPPLRVGGSTWPPIHGLLEVKLPAGLKEEKSSIPRESVFSHVSKHLDISLEKLVVGRINFKRGESFNSIERLRENGLWVQRAFSWILAPALLNCLSSWSSYLTSVTFISPVYK